MPSEQSKNPKSTSKRKRGRPQNFLKIGDTPENVARSLWGERTTNLAKNQGNQTLSGA